MLSRAPFDGVRTRTALLIGFGLTFGIWAFTGYHFTQRMSDVEQQAASINQRYTRAQELLATVRAQVLLGSVFVRDALLDPNPASADDYRRQLRDTYHAIDDALQQYVPIVDDPAERQRVLRLTAEINDFRKTMLDVLATNSAAWPSDARLLLRTRVFPKRQTVLELSEQVQALNRATFVNEQAAVAHVYRATQRSVWLTLSLALLASIAIALVATLHAGRLEDRLSEQRAMAIDASQELQRLSAKLITAQEEERRVIARELHDEVGQVLTAIKVELAVAAHALEAGGRAEVLGDARRVTDGAIQTVRDLSHALHPAMLDDLGLAEAVAWYAQGFSRRYGVRVDVVHDAMHGRFATEVEASAYRIVQEALTNIAKHASATYCRIVLQRLGSTVTISIEDNGVGFEPGLVADRAASERGLGLVGIRERVAQLGGTLDLDSAPGKGTRLRVEFPASAAGAQPVSVANV